MILLFDFSRVILFPKDDTYAGSLNEIYKANKDKDGFTFFDTFKLNEELIDYLRTIKEKVDLYIFTSDVIQDAPELASTLASLFKKVFSASKMNTSKTLPESFKMIAEDLKVEAKAIVYVDDNEENINAANSAGLKTILYKNNEDLFSQLKKYA